MKTLFFLIIHFTIVLFAKSCKQYTSCMECNYIDSCNWKNSICVASTDISETWFKKVSSCSSINLSQVENRCGFLKPSIPSEIQMPKNQLGSYGDYGVFCSYLFVNYTPKEFVIVNVKNNNNAKVKIALQLYFSNNKTDSKDLSKMKTYKLSSTNLKYILIIVYFLGESFVNPFVLTVTYEEGLVSSYLALFISIGVFLVSFIIAILLFRCIRSVMEKNEARNAVQANRLRVEALNMQGNEQHEHNKKVIEDLFSTSLKPILYNEKVNPFQSNCTICLEMYNESSNVVTLTCKHLFHAECIKEWALKNINEPKCPNCNSMLIEKIPSPQSNLINIERIRMNSSSSGSYSYIAGSRRNFNRSMENENVHNNYVDDRLSRSNIYPAH